MTGEAPSLAAVRALVAAGERGDAFRQLIALWTQAGDDLPTLKAISDELVGMREFSSAADIRAKILATDPDDAGYRLDCAEVRGCMVRDDNERQVVNLEIDAITRSPDFPPGLWGRASHLYLQQWDVKRARRAAHRSLEAGGDEVLARRQIVFVERHSNPRRCLAELRTLSVLPDLPVHLLLEFAALAAEAKDPGLAVRFARLFQERRGAADSGATVVLAGYLVAQGEREEVGRLLAPRLEVIATSGDPAMIVTVGGYLNFACGPDDERRFLEQARLAHPEDAQVAAACRTAQFSSNRPSGAPPASVVQRMLRKLGLR